MIEVSGLNVVFVLAYTAFVFYKIGHKHGRSDERMASILGRPHDKADSRRTIQEKEARG